MNEALNSLAARVGKLAQERGLTLATVESCTAGGLAHLLSQLEGASLTLHGGFVVYTKDNKIKAVGVPQDLITRHTAVSAEVAQAMADGGLERSPADVVAAITGVAGPDPDDDGNPVGLVYVAIAGRDGRRRAIRHEFGALEKGDICARAMASALGLFEEWLRPAPHSA